MTILFKFTQIFFKHTTSLLHSNHFNVQNKRVSNTQIFETYVWHLSKRLYICQSVNRGVAQLGSARRSGRRGRRFKSCHPDRNIAKTAVNQIVTVVFCLPGIQFNVAHLSWHPYLHLSFTPVRPGKIGDGSNLPIDGGDG